MVQGSTTATTRSVTSRPTQTSRLTSGFFIAYMKLTTLSLRLKTIGASRVQTLQSGRPGVVERKRGSAGVKDRESIKRRDRGMCQSCGRLGRVVDHIIPLWAGGSDDESNKQLLCYECHDTKTKREAKERAGGGSNFGETGLGHRVPSHADKKFHISN